MITLKRFLIDDAGKLLHHISLDTEPSGYFASFDRFFRGEFVIKKPWIGKVDVKGKSFRVIRTKSSLFNTGFSMIEVFGKLTEDQKKIEVKFRPIWYAFLNVLWVTIFLAFVVSAFFNDFYGWIIFFGWTILQLLLLILDFRKTEQKFVDYISHVSNNVVHRDA